MFESRSGLNRGADWRPNQGVFVLGLPCAFDMAADRCRRKSLALKEDSPFIASAGRNGLEWLVRTKELDQEPARLPEVRDRSFGVTAFLASLDEVVEELRQCPFHYFGRGLSSR